MIQLHVDLPHSGGETFVELGLERVVRNVLQKEVEFSDVSTQLLHLLPHIVEFVEVLEIGDGAVEGVDVVIDLFERRGQRGDF